MTAPAVVVPHEVFGLNVDIRKTCDELAEQGFIAVAPDLFWRQEPGVDLGVNSEPDWQHGLRLYQRYDRDAGVGDVRDTSDQTRHYRASFVDSSHFWQAPYIRNKICEQRRGVVPSPCESQRQRHLQVDHG